jgi:small conductance mechanosensitive channel
MPLASLLALHQVGFYLERLQELVVLYIPRLLSAVLMLVVGWWLIGWGSRLVAAATARLDVSLSSFLTSMFSIALRVLLLMSAARLWPSWGQRAWPWVWRCKAR